MARPGKVKTLVIPDLHCRHHRIEEIIAAVNPKRTIFLGDYFDNLFDTPAQNEATAKWLRKSIHTPGRIHLLGNHDLGYAYDQKRLQNERCGWSRAKFKAINKHMSDLDWAMLNVFYFGERDFILSHAGLQVSHIPARTELENLPAWIIGQEESFFEAIQRGTDHWFLNVGVKRGGRHEFGGPFWADFKEHQPIPGWHQVIGHTPGMSVKLTGDQEGSTTCIDTLCPQDKYPAFVGLFRREFDVQRTVDLIGSEV